MPAKQCLKASNDGGNAALAAPAPYKEQRRSESLFWQFAGVSSRALRPALPRGCGLNNDGKFEPIPGAEETIVRIFKLKLKGSGKSLIERTLNEGATWVPPKNKTVKEGRGGRVTSKRFSGIKQSRVNTSLTCSKMASASRTESR
jgi:hypothetical protein